MAPGTLERALIARDRVGATPGAREARVGRGAAIVLAQGAGLLLAVPLWAWWVLHDGGFGPSVFLPGVAYLAAAALVCAVALPRSPLRGPRRVALLGVAALATWTAASLAWAPDRGAALVAAERAWLLLGAVALPLLWPPSRTGVQAGLVAWVCCGVAAAVAGLVAAFGGGDALPDGRLAAPVGYVNAAAALFAMGAFPALVAAGRRETAPWARVGGLAAGGGLAGAAVLAQSRGIVGVVAVALVVTLVLSPARLRTLVPFGLVALTLLAASGPLLALRADALAGHRATGAAGAAVALILVTAVLGLAGWALVAIDVRWRPSAARVRRWSRAVGAAGAAVGAAGALAFALAGHPASWASERWADVRTADYGRVEAGGTRFSGGLGSNRADYWRVALREAGRRPLTGAGAEQFAATYFRDRHTAKASRYAHSVWLGTAAELGLPGLAALVAGLAALATAFLRASRGAPDAERALRGAAVLPLVVLLLHASADWSFAFPGLAVPALGLAAAATAPGRRRAGWPPRAGGGAPAWLLVGVLAAAAAVAAPLFLSERLVDRAAATAAMRPDGALADLDRAARLNRLSARPDLVRGIVALDLRRRDVARAAFARAAELDASAWYPRFALGLLDSRRSPRRAEAELTAAAVRNPREPAIRAARRALAGGRTLDPLAAQRAVLSEPG